MLPILTAGRSLTGIYRELRQLRRLTEAYFRHAGILLPETPYERFKSLFSGAGVEAGNLEQDIAMQPDLDEEREAKRKSEQIVQDIAAGRDPGTKWRPW